MKNQGTITLSWYILVVTRFEVIGLIQPGFAFEDSNRTPYQKERGSSPNWRMRAVDSYITTEREKTKGTPTLGCFTGENKLLDLTVVGSLNTSSQTELLEYVSSKGNGSWGDRSVG